MKKLVIATTNPGKVREFRRILSPLGVEVCSAAEAGIDAEVEETGTTFAENARLKAEAVMRLSGLPAIADDSGLCVDALGGAPGVYSARWADGDMARIEKLLYELRGVPKERRGAHFTSAICCMLPDGGELAAEGHCEGFIGFAPRGENGFGYDPVFYTGESSFSELTAGEKDAISHRGKALRSFYEQFKNICEVNDIADK